MHFNPFRCNIQIVSNYEYRIRMWTENQTCAIQTKSFLPIWNHHTATHEFIHSRSFTSVHHIHMFKAGECRYNFIIEAACNIGKRKWLEPNSIVSTHNFRLLTCISCWLRLSSHACAIGRQPSTSGPRYTIPCRYHLKQRCHQACRQIVWNIYWKYYKLYRNVY